jgi:hypothetical protein
MIALATFLLSLAGLAALALAMKKHHRDLWGQPAPPARTLALRGAGWLLVSASLSVAVISNGVLAGIALWLGMVTITGLAVAMTLTFAGRRRA